MDLLAKEERRRCGTGIGMAAFGMTERVGCCGSGLPGFHTSEMIGNCKKCRVLYSCRNKQGKQKEEIKERERDRVGKQGKRKEKKVFSENKAQSGLDWVTLRQNTHFLVCQDPI